MNPAQIQGILRSVVLAAGGLASGLGWLTGIDWAAVAGAVATLGGLVWSIYSNSDTQLVTQAAKSADVTEITTTPAIANAVPSDKVVAIL